MTASAIFFAAGITAVADVRAAPSSRRCPHFNAAQLCSSLHRNGVTYISLGKEVGGWSDFQALYRDDVAGYEAMAATSEFREGLDRLIDSAHRQRIALMCSKQNPLDCHGCLLVGRALSQLGVQVNHLLADGLTMSQRDVEQDLLRLAGRHDEDLLMSPEERLAAAYRERASRVGFQRQPTKTEALIAAVPDNTTER